MREFNVQFDTDDTRVHCVCYLVCATLVSYGLTRTWSLPHLVESTRLWQARSTTSFDWMTRVQLGQLALKLCREHVKQKRRCPQVESIFTESLALDLTSAEVIELWARCRDALKPQKS